MANGSAHPDAAAKGSEVTREGLGEAYDAIVSAGEAIRGLDAATGAWQEEVLLALERSGEREKLLPVLQSLLRLLASPRTPSGAIARMLQSVEALGPALSEPEVDTSPQLARSLQATENAWRAIEREFGLLSSVEVSQRLGSKSPNRSYASDQHSRGRLIAVRRPGGMRYPGFQIDPREQGIRPVIADLIRVAQDTDVSEGSLALWLCAPTGYLDGARPVDRLDHPKEVVEAAEGAFGVQW